MKKKIVGGLLFIGLVGWSVACGDRAATLGNECKSNDDCNTGMLRGVCMQSMFKGGYCTLLCESDADCKKDGFTCGSAEVTQKGPLVTTKNESKYCTKK